MADARRTARRLLVVGLLLAHWLIAVGALREKSTMFDEIAHVAAGYSNWLTRDFRLQPEGGYLPQHWSTLPLVLRGDRFPSLDQPAWWKSDAYAVGYHLFYDEGNDVDGMLLAARAMTALLSLPLGLLVWSWSRRLFGEAGGLVSLVLYAFSPTMLAHAPLVNSDLMATLFFVASAWALGNLLERVSVRTVLLSALAATALFLSKNSAPILVVAAGLLAVVRIAGRRPLSTAWHAAPGVRSRVGRAVVLVLAGAAHVVVAVALIWTVHGFRYSAFAEAEPGRDSLGWETVMPLRAPIAFAREHRLLPEAYLYAYSYVLHHAEKRRAFLAGEHRLYGWWSYFPYALGVKTPLALFALLAIAGLATLGGRREGRAPPGTAPLWALLVAYWATALASHLNAGHRHLLPTYPLMFILAGGAARGLAFGRGRALLVGLLLVAFVAESGVRWPHYLAYFNQLVGGPRHGYRHLVDSSLDWGQDLPGLRRWLEQARSPKPVYLAYFGTGKPEHYGIESTRLPGYYDHWRPRTWYELRGGVYCISANMLQQVFGPTPGPWAAPYERAYQAGLAELRAIAATTDPTARQRRMQGFLAQGALLFEHLRFARLTAFLRQREPDDHVGYSILIYRLTDEEVTRALEGPPVELVPEAWPGAE